MLAKKLNSNTDDDMSISSKSSKHRSTYSEEDNTKEDNEESNDDPDFDIEIHEIILGADKDNESQDTQGDTCDCI